MNKCYFYAKKKTGKHLRIQGKHREFNLDRSVANLLATRLYQIKLISYPDKSVNHIHYVVNL